MTYRKLPVYNVSDFGEDVFLPLELGADGTTAFSMTTITVDAAATEILQYTETAGDKTTFQVASGTKITPIEEWDVLIAANNTIGLVYPANDTAFTRTFTWSPDMNAIVYKTSIVLAAGVNCSAFSGATSVDIGAISIAAVDRITGTILIPKQTFSQISTQLSATGTSIAILETEYTEFFKVYKKNPIDITISIASNKVVGGGSATFQSGFFPIFPYNKLNVMKGWGHSGIGFHIHASLDHADPAFDIDKDELLQNINQAVYP